MRTTGGEGVPEAECGEYSRGMPCGVDKGRCECDRFLKMLRVSTDSFLSIGYGDDISVDAGTAAAAATTVSGINLHSC